MLTHKEVVINNVIIHAKWGKQLNEVKAIMTSPDKVGALALFYSKLCLLLFDL